MLNMLESGLDLNLEEVTDIKWVDDDVAWFDSSDSLPQAHNKGTDQFHKRKDDLSSEQLFGEISMFGDDQWSPDDDIFVLVDHDYENEERLVRAMDKHNSSFDDVTFVESGRCFDSLNQEVKTEDWNSQSYSNFYEDESSGFSQQDPIVFESNHQQSINTYLPQIDQQGLTTSNVYHKVPLPLQPPTSNCYNPFKQVSTFSHDHFTESRGHLSSVSSDEGFSEPPLPPICSFLPTALQVPVKQEETDVKVEQIKDCKKYLRDKITERVDSKQSSLASSSSFKKFVEVKEEEPEVLELGEEDSDLAESNDEEQDDNWKKNEDELLECRWEGCWKLFSSQGHLVRHIESSHLESPRPDFFPCFWLECPRRLRPFNARYKLLIHMRVHSGEKPNKCPFAGCKKAFSRLENLKIHQRSHTGERPYLCQFSHCRKAFSNSSDRAKHLRTHFDTKPYACQVEGCSKKYTDPSSLRKHIKNHGGSHYNKPKKLLASKPVVSAAEVQARRYKPVKHEVIDEYDDMKSEVKQERQWNEAEIKFDQDFTSYDDLNDDLLNELNNDSTQDNLPAIMDSDTENELLEWANMDSENLLIFGTEDIIIS